MNISTQSQISFKFVLIHSYKKSSNFFLSAKIKILKMSVSIDLICLSFTKIQNINVNKKHQIKK